jgi:hypothetical protein
MGMEQPNQEEQGEPQGQPDNEQMEESVPMQHARGGYFVTGGPRFAPSYANTSFLNPPTLSKAPNTNTLVDASSNNLQTLHDKYQYPSSSILPTAISAASSVIGDIAGMSNYNKNMPRSISLPRIAPVNINLQPQREALQRTYNTAGNIALRNSRDAGNASNAYANQIAGISALTDSYGTQMGESYMNESNANQQAGLQVASKNADLASQEVLQNLQLRGSRANANANYINSLSQTIPMALRDYREQISQNNMYNTLSKDYGLYEKINRNESLSDKIRRGILGPHYTVLNKDNPYINGQ